MEAGTSYWDHGDYPNYLKTKLEALDMYVYNPSWPNFFISQSKLFNS
jgi:hypothetical protein